MENIKMTNPTPSSGNGQSNTGELEAIPTDTFVRGMLDNLDAYKGEGGLKLLAVDLQWLLQSILHTKEHGQ